MKHIRFVVTYIMLIFLFVGCSKSSNNDVNKDEIVAQINDIVFTEGQFKNLFEYWYHKTGSALEPNFTNRKAVFNDEFNKLVIAQVALDNGLESKESIKRSLRIIEKQYLVDFFQKQVIEAKVSVTDEDLRNLFLIANTRIRASHLFAPTLDSATVLLTLLQKGSSFSELAKKVFKSGELANNGGDLGEFGFDEMDVAFELAAFKAPIDSLIGPVKTAQGYSIIKVNSRFTKPLITENEFASNKDNLGVIANRRKTELAKRAFTSEFVSALALDEQSIRKLWNSYENVFLNSTEFLSIEDKFSKLKTQIKNLTVSSYQSSVFNAYELIDELYYSPDLTINRIRDYSTFKNVLIGLSLRAYQIHEAQSNDAYESSDIQDRINYAQLIHLSNEYQKELDSEIAISEEQRLAYYQLNRENLQKPLEFDFVKLTINSESITQEILKMMKKSTVDAVMKHFNRKMDVIAKERTGLVPVQYLGTDALKVQKLQKGQLSDVIKKGEKEYVIYYCLERIEPRLLSYQEAKTQIEQNLKAEELNALRKKIIVDAIQKHKAIVNDEKIKTIALNLN